ncbi:hypothetical protein PanWU01x14_051420 [Parasponia andersonii]|uniref:Uncharacterized protein n=1 Tax=Parasponia andersonii TaxID=3476 RepID=A0A2P5DLZ5_PARAD|nr:hypothetical protein PanWU01x14_051420 [Parasponia andersonii]
MSSPASAISSASTPTKGAYDSASSSIGEEGYVRKMEPLCEDDDNYLSPGEYLKLASKKGLMPDTTRASSQYSNWL